jgi:hypothetical protein
VLHKELEMKKFYLRWVRRILNTNQMAELLTLLHQLLQALRSDEEQNFRNIVTGNQS